MRGQWFIDGTWLPLEEDESDLIELEHLACFRGQQMRDTSYEADVVPTTVDGKDGKVDGLLGKFVCLPDMTVSKHGIGIAAIQEGHKAGQVTLF